MKKIVLAVLVSTVSLFADFNFVTDLKKDLQKDWKNVDFFVETSNIQFRHELKQSECRDVSCTPTAALHQVDRNYLQGSVGAIFLPNTWKVSLSYSGTLGRDVLYGTDYSTLDLHKDNTLVDDGTNEVSWIDIYTKPFSTALGDFGFGYTYVTFPKEYVTKTSGNGTSTVGTTILDKPNSTNTGALESVNQYINQQSTVRKLNFTYNIPKQDRWYDGLGMLYQFELSDYMYFSKKYSGHVLKPDASSHLFSIGINKTMQEVGNGFSFKQLDVGYGFSKYKFYNYNLQQDIIENQNAIFYTVDAIYKNKIYSNSYYVSFKASERIEDTIDQMEIQLGLGFIF